MPKVLVVDDSRVDRLLVGGLLSESPDIKIDYAADGREAVEAVERDVPDLIVSDLVMPHMNGFELVAAIRQRHPLLPVILVTSRGSEDIAVQALQEGAASYVPKSLLAQELNDTVYRVLDVARRRYGEARLMRCLSHSEFSFSLENDRSLIAPLVSYLQDSLDRMGLCDEGDRIRVGVALEEALVNALYHGNLEVSSELREQDTAAYYALADVRARQDPYRGRRIHVRARMHGPEAVFVVRDEGPGFDPDGVPDPTDPENLDKVSGRGLLLMRTFLDEVSFNEAGNEVTMVKRVAKGTAAPADANGAAG